MPEVSLDPIDLDIADADVIAALRTHFANPRTWSESTRSSQTVQVEGRDLPVGWIISQSQFGGWNENSVSPAVREAFDRHGIGFYNRVDDVLHIAADDMPHADWTSADIVAALHAHYTVDGHPERAPGVVPRPGSTVEVNGRPFPIALFIRRMDPRAENGLRASHVTDEMRTAFRLYQLPLRESDGRVEIDEDARVAQFSDPSFQTLERQRVIWNALRDNRQIDVNRPTDNSNLRVHITDGPPEYTCTVDGSKWQPSADSLIAQHQRCKAADADPAVQRVGPPTYNLIRAQVFHTLGKTVHASPENNPMAGLESRMASSAEFMRSYGEYTEALKTMNNTLRSRAAMAQQQQIRRENRARIAESSRTAAGAPAKRSPSPHSR